MALTDYLTGIADAIREKTGTTAKIPALDFADMIRGIASSGATQGKDYDTGVYSSESTFTLARSKYTYAELPIKHSLGRVPKFVYFGYSKDLNSHLSSNYVPQSNAYQYCFGLVPMQIDGNHKQVCQYAVRSYNTTGGTSSGSVGTDSSQPIITADEENIYIHGVDSTGGKIISGINYGWIVF